MNYTVKVKVTNVDGLSHVVSRLVDADSSNLAKGVAQYEVQMLHGHCQTEVVGFYETHSVIARTTNPYGKDRT